MKITIAQYEKSKEQLKKLQKHQETVAAWETAVKGYKAADGQRIVEVQIVDGRTRFTTEKDEEPSQPLLRKSG